MLENVLSGNRIVPEGAAVKMYGEKKKRTDVNTITERVGTSSSQVILPSPSNQLPEFLPRTSIPLKVAQLHILRGLSILNDLTPEKCLPSNSQGQKRKLSNFVI